LAPHSLTGARSLRKSPKEGFSPLRGDQTQLTARISIEGRSLV
jgi:hypothetical protein